VEGGEIIIYYKGGGDISLFFKGGKKRGGRIYKSANIKLL